MKINHEKIDINERIFAVKVQTGETTFSWAVCLKYRFNYNEKNLDDQDFQLLGIHEDLSSALLSAMKKMEEYSFKIESTLEGFIKEICDDGYLKFDIERETFEGCSCIHYGKSDTEFEYGLLSDEFEICRG